MALGADDCPLRRRLDFVVGTAVQGFIKPDATVMLIRMGGRVAAPLIADRSFAPGLPSSNGCSSDVKRQVYPFGR
jgi:hypothetical protein